MSARVGALLVQALGLPEKERDELATRMLRGRSFGKVTAIELTRLVFAAAEAMDPADVDELAVAMTSHLRSLRPEQVAPLGVLPPPTEPNADPRAPGAKP